MVVSEGREMLKTVRVQKRAFGLLTAAQEKVIYFRHLKYQYFIAKLFFIPLNHELHLKVAVRRRRGRFGI